MTQLIIDGVQLPESKGGTYQAYPIELGTTVEMISGRMVKEVRGNAWGVRYQYGYFDEEMKGKVLAACMKGARHPITCGILLPGETEGKLYYSEFFVTAFAEPKFMWSRAADKKLVPMWADFSIELREVRPHD